MWAAVKVIFISIITFSSQCRLYNAYELHNYHTLIFLLPDKGVEAITEKQKELTYLALRKLSQLTGKGLQKINSPVLEEVDLRQCPNITREGG